MDSEKDAEMPINIEPQDESAHPAPCTCEQCEPQDYPTYRDELSDE